MPDLTRSQFCNLVGIVPNQLKTLDVRGHLPFNLSQAEGGRGYSTTEAFLFFVQEQISEAFGITHAQASGIAGSLPPVLATHWAEIVRTGRLLALGTDMPVREVLCGRVLVAYPGQPIPVAGTGKQIEAAVAAAGAREIGSLRISASRVLARLIVRADQSGVRIPNDFWSAPLKYRPKLAPLTPEEIAASLKDTDK